MFRQRRFMPETRPVHATRTAMTKDYVSEDVILPIRISLDVPDSSLRITGKGEFGDYDVNHGSDLAFQS
jgi:hypothetical protein